MASIGQQLRAIRKRRGVSQLEVALVAHVDLATVDDMEHDGPHARLWDLPAVARALDVRVVAGADGTGRELADITGPPPTVRPERPAQVQGHVAPAFDELSRVAAARAKTAAPCVLAVDPAFADQVAELVWGGPMGVDVSWRDLPGWSHAGVTLPVTIRPGLGDVAVLARAVRSPRWPGPVAQRHIAPAHLQPDAAEMYVKLRETGMVAADVLKVAELLVARG